MTPVKQLQTKRDTTIDEAIKAVLDMKPTTVIIFGYADGTISFQMSESANRLELIAALEIAKHHLMPNENEEES